MKTEIAQEAVVTPPADGPYEDSTIEFYDRHADEYFDRTVSADMSALYEKFLRHLCPGGAILDVGAGSGRDLKALRERGFRVVGIDGSQQLAERASQFSGATCIPIRFDQLKFKSRFDGVWACASLIHISKQILPIVLRRLSVSLKSDGVLFVSVRDGDGQGTADDGRFFAYYRPDELRVVLANAGFRIEELWVSEDRLANRSSIQWINAVAHKDTSTRSRGIIRNGTRVRNSSA